MKRTIIIILLLIGTISTSVSGQLRQSEPSIEAFWQKFKKAVTEKNIELVADLSAFPIKMPYGVKSIKNKIQLQKNYREVFNRQTNATKCFAKAIPEIDQENPKLFTIACSDTAGNAVVIYSFVKTKIGWKLASLDNINE